MQCWRKVCSLWNVPSLNKLQTAIDIADNTNHFMPLINVAHVPNEEVDSHTAQWSGYGMDERRTFFFRLPSRPAVRLTQPSINWELRALSPDVHKSGHESNHSHKPHPKFKMACSYTSAALYIFRILCLIKQGNRFSYIRIKHVYVHTYIHTYIDIRVKYA